MGCAADLATMSSGAVGCPAPEIEISDHTYKGSSESWIAECRGKTFYCSTVSLISGRGGGGMSIDCTEGIEGTVDYQAGVENLKKVAADNYYYEFVPSRPELKDVEKKIVLMVLSAEWSEDGPTNYDALNKIAPGGYWTAHPKEMTEYEVSYIRGVQAWYWHVDLNTEEVTYLRSDE